MRAERRLVLTSLLLAWCPSAFALDPKLDVSQYAHASWKIREGFTRGTINAIAQTPDGYLWLGTDFRLLRFDGVRYVAWQPPPGEHLPATWITSLLSGRDGTLWIGTLKGLASWKDGKLSPYPALDGQMIARLVEDREGTVWAGATTVPTGRLCRIRDGGVTCQGEDGSLGLGVVGLHEDGRGNLWAGVANGLWRWKPGPPRFYPLSKEQNGIQGLADDVDGALLVGMRGGVRRFVDGRTEAYPLAGIARPFPALRIHRDRDGGVWIGTVDRGIVHVHQGRTDVFSRSAGLSGDDVGLFFEDREGSIWVSTANGLDRFRDLAVPTFSMDQGLSAEGVSSVLADTDGSVWLSTPGGLNQWRGGHFAAPRTGSAGPPGKLDGQNPHSLFRDRRGRIWVSTSGGIGYLESERFVSVRGVPEGNVQAIAEDRDGNLWIANVNAGLLRLSPRNEVRQIPW